MMSEQTQDHATVFIPDVRASEVAAIELTSMADGVNIIANSDPEDGNSGDSETNIDQVGENMSTRKMAVQLIARAIKAVGSFTVAAAGGRMFSKPAHGHNKLPYYVTLVVIFAIGVTELFTGVWISMSGLTYRRQLWIGGIVLFLSIWPLIGMQMGGFA